MFSPVWFWFFGLFLWTLPFFHLDFWPSKRFVGALPWASVFCSSLHKWCKITLYTTFTAQTKQKKVNYLTVKDRDLKKKSEVWSSSAPKWPKSLLKWVYFFFFFVIDCTNMNWICPSVVSSQQPFCVSRPPVEGCRVEPDSLAERWNSRQKPEGDEGGDPGHASRDEKTTAGREEEHRWGGDGVRTHMSWTLTNTHTRAGHASFSHTHKKKQIFEKS